jgi:hypothetical protein
MNIGRLLIILVAGLVGAVVVVVLVGVMLFAFGGTQTRSPFEPGEAARQMAALREKVSGLPQAASVEIDAEKMTIELQNSKLPETTDAWTVSHVVALHGLIDWTHVSGPEGVQNSAWGVPVKDRVFDLAQIDFEAVSKIAQAAIERVALEEPARVTRMDLSKAHILIPVEQAGPLRWMISVASPHESADVYADPAGRLTSVDLSRTLRAQRLDFFQGGQPLLDAAKAIAAAFDGKERISHLLIYSNAIVIRLASAGPDGSGLNYICDINGVSQDRKRDAMPAVNPPVPEEPFSTGEFDWAQLPRLVAAARQELAMLDAKVELLRVRKVAHGLASPSIEWEFELQAPAGTQASITLDSSGKTLRAPRGKSADLLTAGGIGQFFDALRANLGLDAAIMEINIGPKSANIDLRDPRKPTSFALLVYDGSALDVVATPPGRPGQWRGLPYADDWFFDLSAIDAQMLQDLPARESAAVNQLRIPGGKVTGIAFGRQKLIFANNRQLVLEVEVTGINGANGRVFFDPSGKILRSDGP